MKPRKLNIGDIVSNGKYCFIYGGIANDGYSIQIEPWGCRGGVKKDVLDEIYHKASKEEEKRLLGFYKSKGYRWIKKTKTFLFKFKPGDKIQNKDPEWKEETYIIKEIKDNTIFFDNKWNSQAPIDYIVDNFKLCRNRKTNNESKNKENR
jgi:hypothetical protein